MVRKKERKKSLKDFSEVIGDLGDIPEGSIPEYTEETEELKDYYAHTKARLNHPIVLKRGELFRNWWNSNTLYVYLQLTKCPICNEKLKVICERGHTLSHEEHLEMAREKYEDALHNEEDNKTLEEVKNE